MKIIQNKKTYVYAGFIWCLLFALMSFYWASGGMVGVKSLGGVIYEKAVEKEPFFIALVWGTGFAKICAGMWLLFLLREWSTIPHRIVYLLTLTGGIFLFLYGLVNFMTLVLSSAGFLSLEIAQFALKWRLIFWEPFWMLGGVLFISSALMFKKVRVQKSRKVELRVNKTKEASGVRQGQ